MAVTSSSNSKSKDFISRLAKDYPQFKFASGSQDNWSPRTKTITYNASKPAKDLQCGVLHELAHALLGHANYTNDFELVNLESEAWELASKMSKKYNIKINDDHIQNCLDTYRDWLHRRSACPACGMHVLQKDATNYHCFNCQSDWHVSNGRFVRPYRRTDQRKTT